MRGLYYVEQAQEGVVFLGQGLGGIYVDSSASDFAGLDAVGNGLMVTAATASAVDDAHAVLHFSDGFGVNHVLSFFGQRCMDGDIVGAFKQCVQINQLYADLTGTLFRNIGVIANGNHFHALHAFGNAAADAAYADDAQGATLHLDAGEGFAVPFAFLDGLMGLGNVACHGHEHGYGVFGGGHGVAFGSVEYDNAFGSGSGDVDIVDAYAGAADNLETGASFDNFFSGAGEGAGDESVIIIDYLDELVRLHVRHNIYIKMLAQQCYAFFTNIITYEYFHWKFLLVYGSILIILWLFRV